MSRFRINTSKKAVAEPPIVHSEAAIASEPVAGAIPNVPVARASTSKRARPAYTGRGVAESKGRDDEDESDTVEPHEPDGAGDGTGTAMHGLDTNALHAIVPFGMSMEDQANAAYVNGVGLAPMARPVAETKHGMRQFVISQHGVRMFIQ